MKNKMKLFLISLFLFVLILPVMAFGPDYGDAYKEGYTYQATTIGLDYKPAPIAGKFAPWSMYLWDIRYNGTSKPYPNILWVYDALMINSTGAGSLSALPPVLESKVKYYNGENLGFIVKYKFIKYMDRPDLGGIQGMLYGNFEYVDYVYLNSLTSETIFIPTVLYDNITCYPSYTGCQGAEQGFFYGNEISTNQTAQGTGFAIQKHSSNEVMFSVTGRYFYSSFAKWKTLYQVWNNIADFSKLLIVNRTTEYTQLTKVKLYQDNNISWETTYDTTNITIFLAESPGKFVVNATGWNEQIIFDDSSTCYDNIWNLDIGVYDGSTSLLNKNINVDITDETEWENSETGFASSGIYYYSGIKSNHFYNISVIASGMNRGYANFITTDCQPPTYHETVNITIYPEGFPSEPWDFIVNVFDESTYSKYYGATVIKIDEDNPIFNEIKIATQGSATFSALPLHHYNISATDIGMSIGYIDYFAFDANQYIINIWIRPIKEIPAGKGILEFRVINTASENIQNAKITLTDNQINFTSAFGYTYFQVNAPASYGFKCDKDGYYSVTGNISVNEYEQKYGSIILTPLPVITPTPAPTIPGKTPTNPIEAIYYFFKTFGVTKTDNVNLIIAMCICLTSALILAYYTRDGLATVAGGAVGFIICLGLGLIPIWILIAAAIILGLVIAIKYRGA